MYILMQLPNWITGNDNHIMTCMFDNQTNIPSHQITPFTPHESVQPTECWELPSKGSPTRPKAYFPSSERPAHENPPFNLFSFATNDLLASLPMDILEDCSCLLSNLRDWVFVIGRWRSGHMNEVIITFWDREFWALLLRWAEVLDRVWVDPLGMLERIL